MHQVTTKLSTSKNVLFVTLSTEATPLGFYEKAVVIIFDKYGTQTPSMFVHEGEEDNQNVSFFFRDLYLLENIQNNSRQSWVVQKLLVIKDNQDSCFVSSVMQTVSWRQTKWMLSCFYFQKWRHIPHHRRSNRASTGRTGMFSRKCRIISEQS